MTISHEQELRSSKKTWRFYGEGKALKGPGRVKKEKGLKKRN